MSEAPSANPQARIAQMLAEVWKRNQPQVQERLLLLERAAERATAHTLTHTLREEAIATAHKLAGTLGMFGFHQATEDARALEQALEADELEPMLISELTARLRPALFPVERQSYPAD